MLSPGHNTVIENVVSLKLQVARTESAKGRIIDWGETHGVLAFPEEGLATGGF